MSKLTKKATKKSKANSTATATLSITNRWVVILWLLTLLSAFAVVTVRHQNRLAFIAWQKTEAEKIELQSERGRLTLEKATWAGRRNIFDDARKRLAMVAPAPDKIITLTLTRDQ